MLLAIYAIAAAASFSAYFAKWAFRDGAEHNSLVAALAGTSARPFAYRQLVPMTASFIVGAMSVEQSAAMAANYQDHPLVRETFARAKDADGRHFAAQYRIAYYLVYLLYLGALIALAFVCHHVTGDETSSILAPLLFALLYPLLLVRGGYYYDLSELFFFAVSALCALRGKLVLLVALSALATLNKESFFFWLLCLWPLLPASMPVAKRGAALAASIAASLCVYACLRVLFSANPGGAVEFHLEDNIRFYLDPIPMLLGREYTYGLPMPRGFSIVNLLLTYFLVKRAWPLCGPAWRGHAKVALAISIPLFLLFCWRDELRNLSMLFVLLCVLLSCAIQAELKVTAAKPGGARL